MDGWTEAIALPVWSCNINVVSNSVSTDKFLMQVLPNYIYRKLCSSIPDMTYRVFIGTLNFALLSALLYLFLLYLFIMLFLILEITVGYSILKAVA